MCVLFFSDIHGFSGCLRELTRWVEHFQPQRIVLLGDLLYSGRNHLPADYNLQEVAERLNTWKDKIVALRGNCDRGEDQILLEFPLRAEYSTQIFEGRKFFLSHGHLWHPGHLPPLGSCDVLAFGHTHVPEISIVDGICCFNPGSPSLPRGGFPPSFGCYQQQRLTVLELHSGKELLGHNLTHTPFEA